MRKIYLVSRCISLTFSFLTQLEAPAARSWLVCCSPVAHLTREGSRKRRGEKREGKGGEKRKFEEKREKDI